MNRHDILNAYHSKNNIFKSNIFHGHCIRNHREHVQRSFKTNKFNVCSYEIENQDHILKSKIFLRRQIRAAWRDKIIHLELEEILSIVREATNQNLKNWVDSTHQNYKLEKIKPSQHIFKTLSNYNRVQIGKALSENGTGGQL